MIPQRSKFEPDLILCRTRVFQVLRAGRLERRMPGGGTQLSFLPLGGVMPAGVENRTVTYVGDGGRFVEIWIGIDSRRQATFQLDGRTAQVTNFNCTFLSH